MHFNLTSDDLAFRDGLRAWLAEHWREDWARMRRRFASQDAMFAFLREWQRRLFDAGYIGLSWPREYGGRGATIMQQAIFYEEIARARAPELPNVIGLDMAGPALIAHGTDAQKRAHLPQILSAEQVFCQGFSEPDAGSDLAALQTRAARENGHFVVSGQKVWTTYAQYAEWCILLARTDPAAPKHKGLTFFLVDMRAPGVTVRPLRQISGEPEFNEMFFDGVRVPAENVVGRVNGGWEVAITTLMFERGPRTISRQLHLRHAIDAALDLARATPRGAGAASADPVIRQRLAQLVIDGEALRFSNLRALTRMLRGEPPGAEGSAAKLFWSEAVQRALELMLDIEGPYAQLTQGGARAVEDGYWQQRFLRSRGDTIAAGTSEINRNIVAERVLGLPKD
ncbi:MAG: acyl-CoA dehydrogenase family protein [Candidatus Rokubacteria bacterium]|nr:acyl-CoA dehydrogenase family protein [Candidatus Rokubacteria bacterium]